MDFTLHCRQAFWRTDPHPMGQFPWGLIQFQLLFYRHMNYFGTSRMKPSISGYKEKRCSFFLNNMWGGNNLYNCSNHFATTGKVSLRMKLKVEEKRTDRTIKTKTKHWVRLDQTVPKDLTSWFLLWKGLPWWFNGKESACNAGDLGSNPGTGRSPGGGNFYPLQYSCLENSIDIGIWQPMGFWSLRLYPKSSYLDPEVM